MYSRFWETRFQHFLLRVAISESPFCRRATPTLPTQADRAQPAAGAAGDPQGCGAGASSAGPDNEGPEAFPARTDQLRIATAQGNSPLKSRVQEQRLTTEFFMQ